MSPDSIPLLLDVDTGIDDALALLYACASPDAELVAVTCLSGNAALADTERNTRAVLELAGRGEVEVAAGRPTPLLRALEITPETHGPRGLGYAELPDPSTPASSRFGPDVIVEAARSRPGEVTLVTLGPLTNLAIALLAEPRAPAAPAALGVHGRGVPRAGQHDAGVRVERPLRSGGRAARLRRLAGGDRRGCHDPPSAGARPRRDGAGAPDDRRRRRHGPPGPAAGRTTRSTRAATRWRPSGGRSRATR